MISENDATLVSLDDIAAAAERLRGVINRTPLQVSRTLGALTGAEVYFKPESLQRTGSFKIRGAYNCIATLPPEQRARGVITYSSGNHAQAVACAAALVGVPAVVVMPEDAVPAKVAATKGYGAQVVHYGLDSLQRQQKAEELQAAHGYVMVPPFDHPAIIAGQGTVGLEIVQELPDVEVVLVPIGGGGLISGVATAVKELRPQAQVIGVEPAGAPDAYRSLRERRIVQIDTVRTIADGLRNKRLGRLNFAHIRRYVDDIVLVEEEAIFRAIHFLLERAKLVVEPSGAVTVAALLSGAFRAPGKRIVAVLSGGNIDRQVLLEALESRYEVAGAG
jgi:threonine ammonia-lyase medium form